MLRVEKIVAYMFIVQFLCEMPMISNIEATYMWHSPV
jgi:hypothetical protein